MKDIVICGAGGLGKEVQSLIENINREEATWNFLGYYDDAYPKKLSWNGYPILGNIESLNESSTVVDVIVAIGDPKVRASLVSQLIKSKVSFAKLIHPSAIIMDESTVSIGPGSIISAGCILTADISIGDHVLVNLNTTIGHDCQIESYSSMMCGVNLAGAVKVGESSFIGSGSNILNQVTIGRDSVIGAGAVVTQDIPKGKTAKGVPAKWA